MTNSARFMNHFVEYYKNYAFSEFPSDLWTISWNITSRLYIISLNICKTLHAWSAHCTFFLCNITNSKRMYLPIKYDRRGGGTQEAGIPPSVSHYHYHYHSHFFDWLRPAVTARVRRKQEQDERKDWKRRSSTHSPEKIGLTLKPQPPLKTEMLVKL